MRAYAVRLLRLRRIEFSVRTAHSNLFDDDIEPRRCSTWYGIFVQLKQIKRRYVARKMYLHRRCIASFI